MTTAVKFLILTCLVFSFICIGHTGFAQTPSPADAVKKIKIPEVKVPQVKAPEVKAPKVPDSLKKPGMLKALAAKLVKAIQFSKNFKANEKKRVTKLIDSLVIKNPAVASTTDLKMLNKSLSDSTRRKYNELLVMLLAMQKRIDVLEDTTADSVKNQQTINTLVGKVVPLLKSVENSQVQNLSRQKRIQTVKSLFGQPASKTDTSSLNDTLKLVYKLKLKHKKTVLGYVTYENQNDGVNYNYQVLDGVMLYTYQVNPVTGYVKDLSNIHTAAVVKQAVANKDNIYLTFFSNGSNIASLLSSTAAQNNFSTDVVKLLKDTKATGVNIYFENLNSGMRFRFTNFMETLYKFCKSNYNNFQLSVTLPGIGDSDAYNLQELDPFVTNFILDFSKNFTGKPGPLAPLAGYKNNNIQSSIARFTNKGIPPGKFLMCMPYQGIRWSYAKPGAKGTNPTYLSYKDIRAKYENAFYNLDTTAAFSTSTAKNGAVDTVWYDDENTLAKKYDYIFLAKLGGVAVWNLEDGDGYGELWDALTDKFIDYDTVKVKKLNYSFHPAKLTFFEKIQKYYYLFDKPCDTVFNAELSKMLKIRSEKENEMLFTQTVLDTRHALLILNISLLVIMIAAIVVLIYFIRLEGEWWPWKKPLIGFILVVIHLLILTFFMALYLDDSIPWFGASDTNCINLPFHVLFIIVFVSLAVGMAIMRFLIVPFLKREEIP